MTDDCPWVHDVCSGEGGRCAIYGTAPASMFDDNDLLVAFEVIRELRAEVEAFKQRLLRAMAANLKMANQVIAALEADGR